MNIFESQLLALAESLAEQLVGHLVSELETKLGLSLVVPSQEAEVPKPESVE